MTQLAGMQSVVVDGQYCTASFINLCLKNAVFLRCDVYSGAMLPTFQELSIFSFYLYLKYEASTFLPNVDNLLPHYSVSHPRSRMFVIVINVRTSNHILHFFVFLAVFVYSGAAF